jgi:hypothetical protein
MADKLLSIQEQLINAGDLTRGTDAEESLFKAEAALAAGHDLIEPEQITVAVSAGGQN